jgi:hypothetical protein
MTAMGATFRINRSAWHRARLGSRDEGRGRHVGRDEVAERHEVTDLDEVADETE